jgi:hypothetical protein
MKIITDNGREYIARPVSEGERCPHGALANEPCEQCSAPACSDADRMRHDLEFIAGMLMEVVVVQQKRDDFYICEAWEVAKKYRPNAESEALT